MAFSEVQICNLALAHVGISQAIASLESTSNDALQCRLQYGVCRDLMLRDFAWPFARKFRALDLVDTADGSQDWTDQWTYAYRYPVDAVRILGFLVGNRIDPITRPMELGDDTQGQLIYCDEASARVAYVSHVTNPARFPADFVEALAWKIASRLALPLAARPDLREQAEQAFQRAVAEAKVSALNEREIDDQPAADQLRARD